MNNAIFTLGNWIGGYAVAIALCSMLSGLAIGLGLSVITMFIHGSYMGGFVRIGIPALNSAYRFLNLRLRYADRNLLLSAASDAELL